MGSKCVAWVYRCEWCGAHVESSTRLDEWAPRANEAPDPSRDTVHPCAHGEGIGRLWLVGFVMADESSGGRSLT